MMLEIAVAVVLASVGLVLCGTMLIDCYFVAKMTYFDNLNKKVKGFYDGTSE